MSLAVLRVNEKKGRIVACSRKCPGVINFVRRGCRGPCDALRPACRFFLSQAGNWRQHHRTMNTTQLARLPVPDLRETCSKYLRSIRPLVSDEEYAGTEVDPCRPLRPTPAPPHACLPQRVVQEFVKPGGEGEVRRCPAPLLTGVPDRNERFARIPAAPAGAADAACGEHEGHGRVSALFVAGGVVGQVSGGEDSK